MRKVLGPLSAEFGGAIAIVQHRGEHNPDLLPELLDRSTALPVRKAEHGDVLEAGRVYVCPPGMHMTTRPCIQLVAGPRRRFVRPSADWMFESAARVYGDRAIGVVLSGAGSDGAVGSRAILEAGGHVIAQDPASCEHGGMPSAALAVRSVARVSLEDIGQALTGLVGEAHTIQTERGAIGQRGATAKRFSSATTVLLADDHQIVLDGLRALLHSEPDLDVIAAAATGLAAVQLVDRLSPDIVVMDISMPDMNGIEATRRIRTNNPGTNVVALSARADHGTAIRALDAGAMGYVGKDGAYAELATAIRTVVGRRRYVSPRIAAVIEGRQGEKRPRTPTLDASEREMIQLTSEGKTAEEVASSLGFSVRFVEGRLARTMRRLGITNIAGLTRYAIREGLTSLDS
jgi:chemotaxis response regulator CheB